MVLSILKIKPRKNEKKLAIKSVLDAHFLAGPYYVVEVEVPPGLYKKSLEQLRLPEKYKILVLATFSRRQTTNPLGVVINDVIINKIANKTTILKEGEIIMVYGNIKDIRKVINDF